MSTLKANCIADAPLTLEGLLELAYPLPNPTSTLEAWERTYHHDLDTFDRDALHRELRRARLRLDLDPRPDPWLEDREQAILQALRRLAAPTRASAVSGPRHLAPPGPKPTRPPGALAFSKRRAS